MIDLEAIRERHAKAAPGEWGRYGSEEPTQGWMEAAPGLTLGTRGHTEPIARMSGYLMDVEANIDFCVAAHNDDIPALLAEVEWLRVLVKELVEASSDVVDRFDHLLEEFVVDLKVEDVVEDGDAISWLRGVVAEAKEAVGE